MLPRGCHSANGPTLLHETNFCDGNDSLLDTGSGSRYGCLHGHMTHRFGIDLHEHINEKVKQAVQSETDHDDFFTGL